MPLDFGPGAFFFVILSRPSTREGVFVHGVGKIKGPSTREPVSVLGLVKNGVHVQNPVLRIERKCLPKALEKVGKSF